jgi:CubicO group peptidase (beta-lactamase class C family)
MRVFLRPLATLLILGLLVSAPAWAQAQAPTQQAPPAKAQKPAKAPAAATKPVAKDPLEGFDAFVEAAMKDWKVPGAAISIVKDGQVIYLKGFGYRDVEKKLPVTPDTLFAVGSTTKAFTAAALGILVDEGKLEWDKPVREYLPGFQMHDDYVTAHLTPRDLVSHRSGLPRHDLLWYGSPFSRREMFERLRYLEPSRGFRDRYQYQNLMFMTAGILVEQLTGGTWEQFIRRRFLDPLEMKTTNFSVNDSQKSADYALPYVERKDVVKQVPFRNIDQVGPAGSINSSVREMANWVIAQLGKGKFRETQVIPEKALQETQTPQVVVSPATLRYDELSYATYGMGWVIMHYRGHLNLQHGGGIDGFTALVSQVPKQKMGLVILTNLGGTPLPVILAYNIYDRLLALDPVDWNARRKKEVSEARERQEKTQKEADASRKAGTSPSHPLADYAGKYEHAAYGTVTVEENSGELKLKYNSFTSPLRHYHYDVFETTDEDFEKRKFTFGLNGKGEVERVSIVLQEGVDDIVFTRMAEPMELHKDFLVKLTGEYQLGAQVVKISLRGEKTLIASIAEQPDYELVPWKGLQFNLKGLKGYSVEFKMATGSVVEMIITQPNGTFTAKRK